METYPIKFFVLNKNELTYEVLIRGEEPASTVLELRKQINKLTPIIPTSDICESGIEPDVDISGANVSLIELTSRVKSLEDKFDTNLFERTRALCNHLYHRIKRIDCSDSKHAEKVKSLSKNLTTSMNKINSLNKSANPTCEPVVSVQTSVDAVPNVSMFCDRSHIGDLQKIRYNGKTCVHAFVQRINEYSTARNIPSNKLLMYATEIFTGDALHWYRSVKDSVTTWDELIVLLIDDFSQFDYDYRLLTEIRNRTQGDTENITIYFAKMTELFSRLTKKISEQEKLDILIHNIRPCYASVLASKTSSINTMESLKTLCRNFEKIQSLTSQFREPPRVTSDTLAPDLSFCKSSEQSTNKTNYYNKHRYNNNPKYFTNKPTHKSDVAAISTSDSKTKQIYCPRCRSTEHSLNKCKADRFLICFKCGTKDVKYPNCPKCQPKSKAKN